MELINLIDEDLTLVDVYASWCGPCKMISPNIEKVKEMLGIKVIKIDADENLDVVKEYSISSIPTLMLFKNKKLISTTVGYHTVEELMEFINNNK